MADHYETLGVGRGATTDEIRRAYLKLARDRHPDRFADGSEKAKAQESFQALTEAYNTLTNEQRRGEYDRELQRPKLGTPAEIAQDAFARAQQLAQAGQDQDAVDSLHVAIHHAPDEPQYHAALGRLLARHSRHARDAALALEKAARLAPQTLAYHLELARLLSAQGLLIRAQKALEPALRLAPGDPEVERMAGELGMTQKPPAQGPKGPRAGFSAWKGLFGKKG